MRPPRLKPNVIEWLYAALKAPLFHGCARIHNFPKRCEAVCFAKRIDGQL
jgi:hypothetical protein